MGPSGRQIDPTDVVNPEEVDVVKVAIDDGIEYHLIFKKKVEGIAKPQVVCFVRFTEEEWRSFRYNVTRP
tara:strand:- start:1127 stop:1336 length:210 start_codon:yes stop_codon:yes gene_type:complete